MKKLLLLLFIPATLFAQKTNKVKTAAKPKAKTTTEKGFTITATVKGLPDGLTVSLLNGQSGASEMQTTVKNESFSFSGTMDHPDFKLLQFQNTQGYIPLFLDNSKLKIIGNKDSLNQMKFTGSPTHSDYQKFNAMIEPYKGIFNNQIQYDSAFFSKAKIDCENFVRKNAKSFIAPLAIIRYNEVAGENGNKIEELYGLLPANVKATPMAKYVGDLVREYKRNAIGTELEDFVQEDTAGVPVKLSSLRGKYVLVDFWASWCRPCREENPNVVAAYNMYKNKNFTVLGVSLDKAKKAWIDAIKMDSLTWQHVSDLKGWSNAVALQFGINSIPQNILLDKEGRILGKNLRGEALLRKLNQLLQ